MAKNGTYGKGFQFKVYAAFIVFIVLLSISFTLLSIYRQQTALKASLVSSGHELVQLLAHNIRIGVFAENRDLVREQVSGVFRSPETLEITVYAIDREIVRMTRELGPSDRDAPDRATRRRSEFERVKQIGGPFHFDHPGYMVFWSPVFSRSAMDTREDPYFVETERQGGQIIGYLNLMVDKRHYNQKLHELLLNGILIAGFFLTVALGAMFISLRRIIRPLIELTEGIQVLEKGGDPSPVNVARRDEIGRLAEAFNTMAASLKDRTNALKRTQFSVDTAAEAILWVQRDGRIAYANARACREFGARAEDLTRMAIADIYDPEAEDRWKDFWSLAKERRSVLLELTFRRVDRTTFPAEALANFFEFEGEEYCFLFIRDITQRKEAEELARVRRNQLIQADKMISLGTIVSGIAHEINNPNNFIRLNTPMLIRIWRSVQPVLDDHFDSNRDADILGFDYPSLREKYLKACDNILEGSRRIEHIVNDLKQFSQPQAPGNVEPVDVKQAVNASIHLVGSMMKDAGIPYSADFRETPPVMCNVQHLEQVIINLLQNACQAIQERGRGIFIETRLDETGKSVVIQIRDEGVGIVPENLPRIFDPFFTTKRGSGGTGLGLAVSHLLIRLYGGSLEFESEPGNGTIARIVLPVAPERFENSRENPSA